MIEYSLTKQNQTVSKNEIVTIIKIKLDAISFVIH